jgi:2-keto-4-pentenoate hydratase/2-oxohepta-3-ene-1,7-dioic acid hydratase in catechol pathway
LEYQHVDSAANKIDLPIGKVVCVGRNYLMHIKELDNTVPSEPLLFIKPSTALSALHKPVFIPKNLGECHNELEVAVLIHKPLKHGTLAQAKDAIWGVGLGLDLTLRDIQNSAKKQGYPWERAKAFDGSCPVSAFIPSQKIDNLANLSFSLRVNNEIRQQGNSQDMLIPILELLVNISETFTLLPGDIVMTGTPQGVAALAENDSLTAELAGYLSVSTLVK